MNFEVLFNWTKYIYFFLSQSRDSLQEEYEDMLAIKDLKKKLEKMEQIERKRRIKVS